VGNFLQFPWEKIVHPRVSKKIFYCGVGSRNPVRTIQVYLSKLKKLKDLVAGLREGEKSILNTVLIQGMKNLNLF
jgi:hypothetical protein